MRSCWLILSSASVQCITKINLNSTIIDFVIIADTNNQPSVCREDDFITILRIRFSLASSVTNACAFKRFFLIGGYPRGGKHNAIIFKQCVFLLHNLLLLIHYHFVPIHMQSIRWGIGELFTQKKLLKTNEYIKTCCFF